VLAAEGCNLHLSSRSAESLNAARKNLEDTYGVKVTTRAYDLGKSDAVVKLARESEGIDILVNNAGAIPHGGIELDESTWREAWDLKVFGFIGLTMAAKSLRAHGAKQSRCERQACATRSPRHCAPRDDSVFGEPSA
jgi:short-subunit dehydrogenase